MEDILLKINKISFELFSYATEDIEEVEKCLLHAIPSNLSEHLKEKIKIKTLEGHFKEPITLMKLKVKSKKAEDCFNYINEKLNRKLDLDQFINRFDESKGSLYLRLDKQSIYDSESKLNILDKGDVIKIRIHFQGYPLKMDNLLNYLKENDYIID